MKKYGYLAIIFTMIVWGLSYISIKIALEVFTPIALVFFRYVFASIFFVLFMVIRKENFRFELKDLPLFFLSSFIGVVLYFYFESMGLKYLTASTSSIILSLVPLVIMISNYVFYKEMLNKIKIFTIFSSIIGIYLIVVADTNGKNSFYGYIFMILAVVFWAVFSETTSRLTKKYNELKVAAIQAYIALILYLPFIFLQDINYELVKTDHWLHVILLGVVASAISFILYVFAMKIIGTTESGLFVNFIPIVTIIFGILILKEVLTAKQVIGTFIIIGSMSFMIIFDLFEEKRKILLTK